MAGAAVNASGQIFLSGSAIADNSTATDSLLNAAQGGDPYDESNISSAADFEVGLGDYNASAPHSMLECRRNYDNSAAGGGGR